MTSENEIADYAEYYTDFNVDFIKLNICSTYLC